MVTLIGIAGVFVLAAAFLLARSCRRHGADGRRLASLGRVDSHTQARRDDGK